MKSNRTNGKPEIRARLERTISIAPSSQQIGEVIHV
jgi:hypothetical protein